MSASSLTGAAGVTSALGLDRAAALGAGLGKSVVGGLGDGLAGSLAIANKSLAGAARGAKLFGSALGNGAAAPATPGAPPPDVYKRKPGF